MSDRTVNVFMSVQLTFDKNTFTCLNSNVCMLPDCLCSETGIC